MVLKIMRLCISYKDITKGYVKVVAFCILQYLPLLMSVFVHICAQPFFTPRCHLLLYI